MVFVEDKNTTHMKTTSFHCLLFSLNYRTSSSQYGEENQPAKYLNHLITDKYEFTIVSPFHQTDEDLLLTTLWLLAVKTHSLLMLFYSSFGPKSTYTLVIIFSNQVDPFVSVSVHVTFFLHFKQ